MTVGSTPPPPPPAGGGGAGARGRAASHSGASPSGRAELAELAGALEGWGGPPGAAERALAARMVVYRRPVTHRAHDEAELAALVLEVMAEQLARMYGRDPEDLL